MDSPTKTPASSPSALERFDALLEQATVKEKEEMTARLGPSSKRQRLHPYQSEFFHYKTKTIRPCFVLETTKPENEVSVRAEKTNENAFRYTETLVIDTCAIGQLNERPELEICKFNQVDIRRSQHADRITVVIVTHLTGELVEDKFKSCVRHVSKEFVSIEGAWLRLSDYRSNFRQVKSQRIKVYVPDTAFFQFILKNVHTVKVDGVNNPLLAFEVDGCKGGIVINNSTLGEFSGDDVEPSIKVDHTVFAGSAVFVCKIESAIFNNVHACDTLEIMETTDENRDQVVSLAEVFALSMTITNTGKTKLTDCRVKGLLRLKTQVIGGSTLFVNDMQWNKDKHSGSSGIGFGRDHVSITRVKCSRATADMTKAEVRIKDFEGRDEVTGLFVRTGGDVYLGGTMHDTTMEITGQEILDMSVSVNSIEKTAEKDKNQVVVKLTGKKKEEE